MLQLSSAYQRINNAPSGREIYPADVMAIQRSIGNRTVGPLLQRMHAGAAKSAGPCSKLMRLPTVSIGRFQSDKYSKSFVINNTTNHTFIIYHAREVLPPNTPAIPYDFLFHIVSCPTHSVVYRLATQLPVNNHIQTLPMPPGRYYLHFSTNCPGDVSLFYEVI
jgi:hypothetical protein